MKPLAFAERGLISSLLAREVLPFHLFGARYRVKCYRRQELVECKREAMGEETWRGDDC